MTRVFAGCVLVLLLVSAGAAYGEEAARIGGGQGIAPPRWDARGPIAVPRQPIAVRGHDRRWAVHRTGIDRSARGAERVPARSGPATSSSNAARESGFIQAVAVGRRRRVPGRVLHDSGGDGGRSAHDPAVFAWPRPGCARRSAEQRGPRMGCVSIRRAFESSAGLVRLDSRRPAPRRLGQSDADADRRADGRGVGPFPMAESATARRSPSPRRPRASRWLAWRFARRSCRRNRAT